MNCKGTWEGYRRQVKLQTSRALSPSRLPLRALFLSIERRLGTRQALYCMQCSCKKLTKFHRRQIGDNVLRFNFFTATVVAPGIPFNPVALALHTSPNEPLPRMFCRSICFKDTSQRDGVTEKYLFVLFEPFTVLRKNKKLIVGFHMTSQKFKLQNYRSY